MFTLSDDFAERRLSDAEWTALDSAFEEACFASPGSGLDWDDLKECVATIKPRIPNAYVAAIVQALVHGEHLIGLVYHSPAQGAYQLLITDIGRFVERMWMGPADIFLIDVQFRWSISLTHHQEIILQVRPVSG